MTNGKIEPGDKFGEWTVIEESKVKKGYFFCHCSCGTERDVFGKNLKNGQSKSCGCLRYPPIKIGDVFGEWTVISFSHNDGDKIYWNCRCSCGTESKIQQSRLRSGKTKCCRSCACQKKYPKIKIGDQFGEWTILSPSYKENKKHKYWLCRCSCGTEREVEAYDLTTGRSKSCGHIKQEVYPGEKYEKLTVIEKVKDEGCYKILCLCDCGKLTTVRRADLIAGRVRSCGCLQRETVSQIARKPIEIGTKFGELTVIKELGTSDRGLLYLVRCSCGKEYEITGSRLREGRISCGHLASKAEYIITNILKDKKIMFIPQWDEDTFRLSSGRKCRFDFAIFKNKDDKTPTFFIEYNGQQHYLFYNSGWSNEENYNLTIQRDAEKAALCKQHNIPLEVIPYTEFDNLESIITSLLNKYETHTIE